MQRQFVMFITPLDYIKATLFWALGGAFGWALAVQAHALHQDRAVAIGVFIAVVFGLLTLRSAFNCCKLSWLYLRSFYGAV